MMKRRYHRKQPIKFMTVEMNEPFYWPELPEEVQRANEVEARARNGEKEPENLPEIKIVFNTQLFRDERATKDKIRDPEQSGNQVPWHEGSDNMLHRADERKGEIKSEAVRPPTVKELRDAYAAEAEKLLAGRSRWNPTWKTMEEFVALTPRDGSRLRVDK
jgi:hypothetical protein